MPRRRAFMRQGLTALAALAGLRTAGANPRAAVEIRDYKFLPDILTVKAGTAVRWINREKRTSHSVQFEQGGVRSDRLFPDESWEHVFHRPGRYRYICDPHSEMKGLIVVTE
jgi:plastocyanin